MQENYCKKLTNNPNKMQKMTTHQKIGAIIILCAFLAVIGLLGSKETEAYRYTAPDFTLGE
jgi:hypothetical protein